MKPSSVNMMDQTLAEANLRYPEGYKLVFAIAVVPPDRSLEKSKMVDGDGNTIAPAITRLLNDGSVKDAQDCVKQVAEASRVSG